MEWLANQEDSIFLGQAVAVEGTAMSNTLKIQKHLIPERVEKLLQTNRELERQIKHDRTDLGSLDRMHGEFSRDVVTLSIGGMEELLREREAFIMGKNRGRRIQ